MDRPLLRYADEAKLEFSSFCSYGSGFLIVKSHGTRFAEARD